MKNEHVENAGEEMYVLLRQLYPICRSITGDGVRKTLNILRDHIPLEIREVPTGTRVLDWTIPKEWNIEDAYIKDPNGKKIVDFKKSNLHVMSYSCPVSGIIPLQELKKHLHTLENYPDWIPYLTTYYNERWGFCMSHHDAEKLIDGDYEVKIESGFRDGSLTYGEYYLKGESEEEVLFSTYLCHPSLCNDNLSGVVLLAHLAKFLTGIKLKYSYRFLFIPETIGAITWLYQNEKHLPNIRFGLVATCVGDPGISTYKKSRGSVNTIDKIVQKVLEDSGDPFKIIDFFPSGSDERQFCSPGFNMPVGSLMRTPYAQFPEYHTSADNLNFVTAKHLADSFRKYTEVIYTIENDNRYLNTNPKGEPQLGRRGLYQTIGGKKDAGMAEAAIQWTLNQSDGVHSLLDIAIQSKIPFRAIRDAADSLEECGLLVPAKTLQFIPPDPSSAGFPA